MRRGWWVKGIEGGLGPRGPSEGARGVRREEDQGEVRMEEEEGRLGALTRHSLTSLGRRRPFSRKPSSWRHPGGTVSETEETDLSETESSCADTEARPGVARHVHSFTFSSLSRFRSKHGSRERGKKDGSQSPGAGSLGVEAEQEEEVARAAVTSPARSPNRKLREARDAVGDRLRAYAQKFKEGKEKESLVRSASAGRSDTIEEETFEDVEAERTGVVRAYSLNSKAPAKPCLLSHSSTESNEVPTPKSTPSRTKKKLSVKKVKNGEEEGVVRGRGKAGRGRRWQQGKEGGKQGEQVEDAHSPSNSPNSELVVGLPEMFRQAILEVDQLTLQLGEEGRVEEGDSSEGGEERVVHHRSRPGSKRKRKKVAEAEGRVAERAEGALTPTARSASFTALDTEVRAGEERRGRLCLSSSPVPSTGQEEDGSPRLLGSSTLPRPTSTKATVQPTFLLQASPPSVLSLQLEGAYGRACSIEEGDGGGAGRAASEEGGLGPGAASLGGSREHTVSPLASQRTGRHHTSSTLPSTGRIYKLVKSNG